MNEPKLSIPDVAQPPPEDPCERPPEYITINGRLIEVSSYVSNPSYYNSLQLPSSYLETVYQDAIKFRSTFLASTLASQLKRSA